MGPQGPFFMTLAECNNHEIDAERLQQYTFQPEMYSFIIELIRKLLDCEMQEIHPNQQKIILNTLISMQLLKSKDETDEMTTPIKNESAADFFGENRPTIYEDSDDWK